MVNQPKHLKMKTGLSIAFDPIITPSTQEKGRIVPLSSRVAGASSLLTAEAAEAMAEGQLPDLRRVCRDLYRTFFQVGASQTALQFMPVLNELGALDPHGLDAFLNNPKPSAVLVRHPLLKVVLIHWQPGRFSSVHGHHGAGGVIKVLKGTLTEKRYTADEWQQFLGVSTLHPGSITYIDDQMGYHAVGNQYAEPAVSLHVYTPGMR